MARAVVLAGSFQWRDRELRRHAARKGEIVRVSDSQLAWGVARGHLREAPPPPKRKPRKGKRPQLWFVTPAYGRYPVSEVCFEQRRLLLADLAAAGVDARCVVVADDRNLGIAKRKGFDTVRAPNDWLGRKFNDGIEHACREGADYVCPIGSDSWIDTSLFAEFPADGHARCSRNYALVDETGARLGELVCNYDGGAHRVYPVALLEPCCYRPARDEISRGVDTSIQRGIEAFTPFLFDVADTHPLESVGFRSGKGPQLNSYRDLLRFRVREHRDPWQRLAAAYPPSVVEQAQALYAQPATRRRAKAAA